MSLHCCTVNTTDMMAVQTCEMDATLVQINVWLCCVVLQQVLRMSVSAVKVHCEHSGSVKYVYLCLFDNQ
jgi:hypothetical protein